MGKRGPQPGWKKGAAKAAPASKPKRAPEPVVAPVLSAADRENPEKLSGEALRTLGYHRGLARSAMADMPDAKIRTELRYLAHRQYEAA